MRETVDVTDEKILLTLREGPQGLKSLSDLANINYNTLRQRIGKLSRYGYISKPGYGEYALTGKGRQFVDDLSTPVAPDFDDPGLKKLIAMLPSELHRAFFRLAICGVIAKYLLFQFPRQYIIIHFNQIKTDNKKSFTVLKISNYDRIPFCPKLSSLNLEFIPPI